MTHRAVGRLLGHRLFSDRICLPTAPDVSWKAYRPREQPVTEQPAYIWVTR